MTIRGINLKLVGAMTGFSFSRDSRMIDHIALLTNVELTDDDKLCLHLATIHLADHRDMFKNRNNRLDIIFAKDGQVAWEFQKETIGKNLNLAIVNYDKFINLEQIKKIVVLVEEMVHHFWDTKDEILVSKIVSECVPNVDYNRENGNYIFL